MKRSEAGVDDDADAIIREGDDTVAPYGLLRIRQNGGCEAVLDRASVVGGRKEVVWSGDDHGHTSCAVFGEATGVGSLSVHSD